MLPSTLSNSFARYLFLLLVLTGCNGRTTSTSATPDNLLKDDGVPLPNLRSLTRDPPAVQPRFENVAEQAGIVFRFFSDIVPDRYFLPEIMGGGAAWFDFDNDGALDLFLTNGCELIAPSGSGPTSHKNGLFRNRGDGRFDDVSQHVTEHVHGYGQGVAVGDYDADGFLDLFLANYGADVLLHNNGDATFTDVTGTAGVADELWGSSAIWLDLDDDADLDLYVTNYLLVTRENTKVCEYDGVVGYCGPGSYEAAPDRVFINQGDGTFVDRTEQLGFLAADGKGLAIAALDFDNDLRPEVYVANDMTANFLFTQSKSNPTKDGSAGDHLRFANVAAEAGCGVSGTGENEASMGVACADFDGDQLVDIFVTHYFAKKNTLYRNLGNLMFHDDSFRTRIAATSFDTLGFGTVAFDFDRDSAIDLFITNGHVLGPKHSNDVMPPKLLRNDGKGSFSDISKFAGAYFQDLWLGRGAAGGDYDNDGDLDLLVTHISRPVALLRNDTRTNHHWLGLDLHTLSRVPPVGGRVVVRVGKRAMTFPIVAGGSYLCSSDPRLLMGLGDHRGDVEVEIHWPSGRVEIYSALASNCYWRITEGQAPQRLLSHN